MTKIKRGLRFYHNYWLDPDDNSKPLLHEVTRTTQDAVYFRPVYRTPEGKEFLGSPVYEPLDRFPRQVLRWAE